jgi:hypothetical protein
LVYFYIAHNGAAGGGFRIGLRVEVIEQIARSLVTPAKEGLG